MKRLSLPSAGRLRQLFTYDPLTGVLTWDMRPAFNSRRRAGDAAGTMHHSGYVQVNVDGVLYLAHRLIFKLVEGRDPIEEIDHENGVRSDNRWLNLREATPTDNKMNRRTPSLHRGVHFMPRSGKYGAQIKAAGGHIWLGSFDTPEAACAAYRAQQARIHGEFAKRGPCGCS